MERLVGDGAQRPQEGVAIEVVDGGPAHRELAELLDVALDGCPRL